MDKKELNERQNDLIKQIKLNSKDAHFAGKLVEDLLSNHRQKCVNRNYVFDLGEELYKINGNTYFLSKHEKGVLFHIYNSFDLVITIAQNSLYGTLVGILDEHEEKYETFSDEEKEEFDTLVEAVAVCLSIQLNMFEDLSFAINIATQCVEHTGEMYKKAIAMPLQDETIEADIDFRDETLEAERNQEEFVAGLKEVSESLENNE